MSALLSLIDSSKRFRCRQSETIPLTDTVIVFDHFHFADLSITSVQEITSFQIHDLLQIHHVCLSNV